MMPLLNTERQAPPRAPDASAGQEHWTGDHPLVDEHAVLLDEVRTRARAARTALGAGTWPEPIVRGLVDYLRYELLDQAVNEERLLFPLVGEGLADPQVHHLVDDHRQLRDIVDHVADLADAPSSHGGPAGLVELLDDLEGLLDDHVRAEEALLSRTTAAGVEARRAPFRCHLWFPLTEGPELVLDVLPREFAHRAAMERFSRLKAGERVLVRADRPLDALWNLLSSGRPGEYGWAYLEEGPARWRAEVTRRAPE
jgi:uncharacterized protein (DUF2249 family)